MKKMVAGILTVLTYGMVASAVNIALDESFVGHADSLAGSAQDLTKAQGTIGLNLQISSQFELKVFNDALAASGSRGVADNASTLHPDQVIDLGLITSGIGTISAGTSCAGLTGLATNLNVTPGSSPDSEMGMTPNARTAQCGIEGSNATGKLLEMRIPLEVMGFKTGNSKLQVDWSINQVAGSEFDYLAVCDSGADTSGVNVGSFGTGPSVSHCGGSQVYASAVQSTPGTPTSDVVVSSGATSATVSRTIEVQASLSGASQKTSYQAYVVVSAGLVP